MALKKCNLLSFSLKKKSPSKYQPVLSLTTFAQKIHELECSFGGNNTIH